MRMHYKSGLPEQWRKSRISGKPANDGRPTSTFHGFQQRVWECVEKRKTFQMHPKHA